MFLPKYVFRSLQKNKTSTSINIIGLSIGIATFLLLALFIKHELDYDKQFAGYKNIYRITTEIIAPEGSQHLAIAPMPLETVLKTEYPEVEATTMITELPDQYIIEYKDIRFRQEGFREASADLFKVLDYKVLYGDLSTALKNPGSVVLTESVARKLFGDDLSVDKEILIDKEPHKVTAILEDLSKNTDLQFSALLSGYHEISDDWLDFDGFLYAKLHPDGKQKIETILRAIENKYYQPLKEALEGVEFKFAPQALSNIHFSNEILADSSKGNILYVYFFSIVGFFILIIACINYINLSFARLSEKNYFEGICKINGANNYQSNYYLLLESLFQAILSVIISILLIFILLPFLNKITDKDIIIQDLMNLRFLGIIILVFLFVITLISILPIAYTVIFQHKKTITRLVKEEQKQIKSYRSGLVALQFVITITLIICLVTFQRQMNFMKNKDLGFNLQNIMVIDTPFDTLNHQKINYFIDQLKNKPGIDKVSKVYGGAIPGIRYGGSKMIHAAEIDGELKQFIVSFCDVDHTYLDLMDIELLEGERFVDNPNTNKNKCIINESYAKALGIDKDPFGKTISESDDIITGVVKDYHFLSPQNPIEPICIRYRDGYPYQLLIKTKMNVFDQIRELWENTLPDQPLLYSYLEDKYSQQYLKDKNVFKIVWFFTLLSILISVLGMFGLVRYTCERKTKDIGIRKVCGAKVTEILVLLNKEFVKKILIAFLVSCPIAWLAVNKWLENFAYKTQINWWIFAQAGIITLTITLITVSWQSWRAATRNPVEALRYE